LITVRIFKDFTLDRLLLTTFQITLYNLNVYAIFKVAQFDYSVSSCLMMISALIPEIYKVTSHINGALSLYAAE
jgi:hypothetical protein